MENESQEMIVLDSVAILQERMFPKAEKVSWSALLSIDLSRFCTKEKGC